MSSAEMAWQIMALLMSSPLSKAEIARALGKAKPTRYLNDLMKKLLEVGQFEPVDAKPGDEVITANCYAVTEHLEQYTSPSTLSVIG